MQIVKKDGTREDFDKQKIINACLSAGLAPDVAEKIGNEVENLAYDGMETKEIRILVLNKVRKADPSCAQKWIDYEQNKT
jgi:transcriptional regulator NrdR family protein